MASENGAAQVLPRCYPGPGAPGAQTPLRIQKMRKNKAKANANASANANAKLNQIFLLWGDLFKPII